MAWRWGLGLLVLAVIGLAVKKRYMRGLTPSEPDAFAEGFASFADARHDLL